MLTNLLLTAWRNLKKNKFFSVLNITGLIIGMSVFLITVQYSHFEYSYENFIPNAANIYRVNLQTYRNNEPFIASAENYPGVGPALLNTFPEVTGYARLYNMGYKNNVIITNEESKPDAIAFKHRRFLYADSSFLSLMEYPMVQGDPKTALAQPFNAVISEHYAKLYFGDADPMGKTLRLRDDDNNNELVKVTGVFKDIPDNSHLKFDVLFSYKTLFGRFERAEERYNRTWVRKDMYTFVTVRPGTDVKALERKLPALVNQFIPDQKQRNENNILSLQPISAIHLTSHLAEEFETNGDDRVVQFISMIGIFILIIAWINYINLATAKALERAKEVGVRKVLGAFKRELVQQFLMESGMVNFFSLVLALGVIALALPAFNTLSGLNLVISNLFEPWFIAIVLTLWAAGTLLSGFYPAVVLSSFKPVTVLKGKLRNSKRGIFLRKSLVVLQFSASVFLIAGTIIVYQQLNYMLKRDIGMNIKQVLVVERPGISPADRNAFNSGVDLFRNELARSNEIAGVSLSVTIPGKQREFKQTLKRYGASDDQLVTLRVNSMDYHSVDIFQMKLLAGRTFSQQYPQDQDTSVIISETASRALGFKTPDEAVGQVLRIDDWEWSPIIVGVVNDYHQVSLKKAMDPTIFYCSPYSGEYYSVRINTNDAAATLDHVRTSWEKAFPGNPFDYFFLDDYFNQQYENEQKFGKLFSVFASLAIIIGCLGLFGLSAYTTVQRTKEIGIRKALGSSEQRIFILLSKEYLILIAIAVAMATPFAWLGMNYWIETFEYRIDISFTVFILAGALVLMIALLSVSFQTLKAAKTNPVDSLRYE
jgi:putative ABC transport system permease protein